MKLTDNKKAPESWRSRSFSVVNKGILTMSSVALSFNEVNFTPVEQHGQVYLTSTELATALGYADTRSVTKIFNRYADEFTSNMTKITEIPEVVNLSTSNLIRKVRIFSLRGCHLIAMFSKTDIAKQFRKWVLDVLDREIVGQKIESDKSISPEQQDALHSIVDDRASNSRKLRAEMWIRHNRHFRIAKYSQLLAIHFEDAKNYLETMVLKTKAEKPAVPQISIEVYEDKDVQYIMWYAPMLARLIFDDIVPALRALDSHKVGSLFSYTQEMIMHVNGLNRRAKEKGIISLAHVEDRLIR